MTSSTLVAKDEAAILTTWPPSSIAPIRRPRARIRRLTRLALGLPSISRACMRAREAAVSAVSAPEKNADANRLANTIRASTVRDMVASMLGFRKPGSLGAARQFVAQKFTHPRFGD